MAGMGPPPKPDSQRRRRNATVATTRLPAEGRSGRAPAWPLPDDAALKRQVALADHVVKDLEAEVAVALDAGEDRDAVRQLRKELRLAKGQLAVLRQEAKDVRAAERSLWTTIWRTPQAVAWERLRWDREVAQYVRWKVRAELGDLKASTEARQLADRLGLNPLALLRLRWEIAADEVGEQRQTRTAAKKAPGRARFKVVDSAVARS